MENEMAKLKFEFVDEYGHSTKIEKEFDYWHDTQFQTVLAEIVQCLHAIGFSEGVIEKYIDLD